MITHRVTSRDNPAADGASERAVQNLISHCWTWHCRWQPHLLVRLYLFIVLAGILVMLPMADFVSCVNLRELIVYLSFLDCHVVLWGAAVCGYVCFVMMPLSATCSSLAGWLCLRRTRIRISSRDFTRAPSVVSQPVTLAVGGEVALFLFGFSFLEPWRVAMVRWRLRMRYIL